MKNHSSMRYVRGSAGRSQENPSHGRGGSQGTSSGRSNRWAAGPQRTSSQAGRGRGRGRGGTGNFAGRGRFSSYSFTRSLQPERNDQTAGNNGNGNQWVRNSSLNDKGESLAEVDASAPASASSKSERADSKPITSLERRGAHKLVMKREKDFSETLSNVSAPQKEAGVGHEGQHTEPVKHYEGTEASGRPVEAVSLGSNKWKRHTSEVSNNSNAGHNDPKHSMERQNDEGGGITSQETPTQMPIGESKSSDVEHSILGKGDTKQCQESDVKHSTKIAFSGNKSYSWKRQSAEPHREATGENTSAGENNIVNDFGRKNDEQAEGSSAKSKVSFPGGGNQWKRPAPKTFNQKQSLVNSENHSGSHKKRKHGATSTGARRIRLLKTSTANDEEDQTENQMERLTGQHEDIANTKEASPSNDSSQKTLTDFCYQDTGRGSGRGRGAGRGRGRGRSSGRGVGRKMGGNIGLIRVKPNNPSSTPICPTFRRGLPCNNPKCTLRHDVSTEASRPICVFFQRNGMCSKGDECPFRHVKVRWDAEICPMFEKVGYCEDPDCSLRHVTKKPRAEPSSAVRRPPEK